jgi:hypothetical protein
MMGKVIKEYYDGLFRKRNGTGQAPTADKIRPTKKGKHIAGEPQCQGKS